LKYNYFEKQNNTAVTRVLTDMSSIGFLEYSVPLKDSELQDRARLTYV